MKTITKYAEPGAVAVHDTNNNMHDKDRPKLKPNERYALVRGGKFITKLTPMIEGDVKEARLLHGDFLNDTCWNWHAQGWRHVTEEELKAQREKSEKAVAANGKKTPAVKPPVAKAKKPSPFKKK